MKKIDFHHVKMFDNELIGKKGVIIAIDPALNHSAFITAVVGDDGPQIQRLDTLEDLGYKTTKIKALSIQGKLEAFCDVFDLVYLEALKHSLNITIAFEEITFASKGSYAALGEAMLQGIIRSKVHQYSLDMAPITPQQHYKINTGKSVHFINLVDQNGKKKRQSINKEVIITFAESKGFEVPNKIFRSAKTSKIEKNDDAADAFSILNAIYETKFKQS